MEHNVLSAIDWRTVRRCATNKFMYRKLSVRVCVCVRTSTYINSSIFIVIVIIIVIICVCCCCLFESNRKTPSTFNMYSEQRAQNVNVETWNMWREEWQKKQIQHIGSSNLLHFHFVKIFATRSFASPFHGFSSLQSTIAAHSLHLRQWTRSLTTWSDTTHNEWSKIFEPNVWTSNDERTAADMHERTHAPTPVQAQRLAQFTQ